MGLQFGDITLDLQLGECRCCYASLADLHGESITTVLQQVWLHCPVFLIHYQSDFPWSVSNRSVCHPLDDTGLGIQYTDGHTWWVDVKYVSYIFGNAFNKYNQLHQKQNKTNKKNRQTITIVSFLYLFRK